jgi:hypothetical protein
VNVLAEENFTTYAVPIGDRFQILIPTFGDSRDHGVLDIARRNAELTVELFFFFTAELVEQWFWRLRFDHFGTYRGRG